MHVSVYTGMVVTVVACNHNTNHACQCVHRYGCHNSSPQSHTNHANHCVHSYACHSTSLQSQHNPSLSVCTQVVSEVSQLGDTGASTVSLTWSAGSAVSDVHQLGDVREGARGTLLRLHSHLWTVVTHWTLVSICTLLGGSGLGPWTAVVAWTAR